MFCRSHSSSTWQIQLTWARFDSKKIWFRLHFMTLNQMEMNCETESVTFDQMGTPTHRAQTIECCADNNQKTFLSFSNYENGGGWAEMSSSDRSTTFLIEFRCFVAELDSILWDDRIIYLVVHLHSRDTHTHTCIHCIHVRSLPVHPTEFMLI